VDPLREMYPTMFPDGAPPETAPLIAPLGSSPSRRTCRQCHRVPT